MSNEIVPINEGEIVLYQPDENMILEVRLENETVWLTQAQMSELFQTTRNNVTLHVRNIFKEGELQENSVCKESLLTAADGKNYRTKFYNLDVIISVGYRVKSQAGTRFRQWANGILKQHLYTVGVGAGMTRLREEHNRQPGVDPIEVYKWRKESHDRWLIVDDRLYHCGHSLNAIGGKMSAIALMGKSPDDILVEVQ